MHKFTWTKPFSIKLHSASSSKTVMGEPAVTDHPKFQARWSITVPFTILSKIFVSLAYGNCQGLPHVLNVLFLNKVNFERKTGASKFSSLALPRNAIMLQHLIFQIHALISVEWSLTSSIYERWSLTRGSKYHYCPGNCW